MKILYGNIIAQSIKNQVKEEIQKLKIQPRLDVILVGNDEASKIYVRNKVKVGEELGIEVKVHHYAEKYEYDRLLVLITKLNYDVSVNGIIVQLPLPANIDKNIVLNVSQTKDVDCFHPSNLGLLHYGRNVFQPPTAGAVIELLSYYKIPLFGKHVVIINDNILLGRPLATMLTNMGSTVTICNKYTENLKSITASADIIVVAVGKRPDFVLTKDYCKRGVKIIDCGINKMDGKVVGDVDVKSVEDVADMLTSVPGGVGVITISVLLKNTLKACKINENTQ